jgi:hypothetical protein
MSDPHQTGDWPTKALPNNMSPPDPVLLSEQLEKELRLQRKKHMPTLMSLGIGIALAVAAYVLFANQQGSFADAGAKIDSDISGAQATSVAAGKRAAAATGDAARNAGASIDDAINRATTDKSSDDSKDTQTPAATPKP